jgi:hypothetical protein
MKLWTNFLAVLAILAMVGVAKAADDQKAPAEKQDKSTKTDKTVKGDKTDKTVKTDKAADKTAKKNNAVKGEVVSVDGSVVKIKTGKKGQEKEVTVATDTKTAVMIEGKTAKLADLKAGQKVNIMMADETGAGPAVKIAVPPAKEKTPKADKAAEKVVK